MRIRHTGILHKSLLFIICLTMLMLMTPTCSAAPEFRAFWADTWHDGILSASQITDMVTIANTYNCNVIIPEVRKCGDAYYNSSPIYCPVCNAYHREPRASNILDPAPFDPLADLITKAHAVGIEVHPWIVTYRIWSKDWTDLPTDHVWYAHRPGGTSQDWSMRKSDGSYLDGNNYNLDPGIPAVQDYICKVVVDIVSRYNVDGFNWDYIRYPTGYYWGYNDITKARFYDEFGYYPPTSTSDTNWGTWAQYRRQQVTDLVRKCYLEIMALKQNVKHSVDTVGWMGGDPNVDYTQTRQYKEVYQDAKSWMQQHIIDVNILMNYKREYDTAQQADYRLWTSWLSTMQTTTGRHSVDGQAAYLNSITDSITQMQVARNAGIGMCTYSYAVTNKDSQPNTDFWSAVKANLYTSKVSTPSMPWKTSPTNGILFGTITDAQGADDPIYLNWLYKATVQAKGPVTLTSTTDATGTYSFIDLTPGTYTLTVSKSGYVTVTGTVTVAAGQVVRRNFALNRLYVSDIKRTSADGTTVYIKKAIVTAGSDQLISAVYIEDENRSSAIKVQTNDTITEGSRISVTGTIDTNTLGERYLKNTKIRVISTGNPIPKPLGLTTKAVGGGDWFYTPGSSGKTLTGQRGVVGGTGLNNVAMLVRVFGKVTAVNPTEKWFYVDDGCGLQDGSGNIGLKVKCYDLAAGNSIPLPAQNAYVKVTGIVSIGTGYVPVLRPRKPADVVTLISPP